MIREYQSADLDSIMAIWLQGNEQAHSFIPAEFFRNNYELVKLVIPASKIYVQDIDGVKGFIGLTDNYIAGLFVTADFRRQGIGQALLQKAKQQYNELLVNVYKQNESAIAFYLSQGFTIVAEGVNEENNQPELLMQCKIDHSIKIGKCAL